MLAGPHGPHRPKNKVPTLEPALDGVAMASAFTQCFLNTYCVPGAVLGAEWPFIPAASAQGSPRPVAMPSPLLSAPYVPCPPSGNGCALGAHGGWRVWEEP